MSASAPIPHVAPLAESGLLVTFGDALSAPLSRRIAALTDSLLALDLPGVIDLVPSYTTLTVLLDPERADPSAIEETIRERWDATETEVDVPPARQVTIPVAYGGDAGPDLDAVAAHTGLAADEVIRRHSAAVYLVAALGFAPGFAFLLGLPPELATPRRAEPRTRVPPGSVGIGAAQTGVYALPTPGGWNLIGRTPRRLFDPTAAATGADPFTLHVGDEVRFEPVAADALEPLDGAPSAASMPIPETADRNGPSIEIVEPGLLTTVQDLGRPGQGRFGVSPGGAVDRGALLLGNHLVGNDPGAAALELTLIGPRLRVSGFEQPRAAALTGTDLGARLNGAPLQPGRPFTLRDGDELAFDPAQADRAGVRAYLCLAGGLDVPVVLGSRATDLLAGFGGWHGRALKAGDRLPLGGVPTREALTPQPRNPSPRIGRGVARQRRGEGSLAVERAVILRFVRGPQADRFDDEAFATFTSTPYQVTSRSDRVGLRLRGAALRSETGVDVISEGMTTGAIQIAGDGQPIVMLPARATIGGYARIGTVIGADLDRLAQLPPGAAVRFIEVSLAEARELTLASLAARRVLLEGDGAIQSRLSEEEREQMQADELDERDVADDQRQDEGGDRDEGADDATRQVLAELPVKPARAAWDARGVRRIIQALARTGATDFELRVESAGLYLRIGRGSGTDEEQQQPDRAADQARQRLAGEAESGMGGAEPLGIDELGVDPSLATGDEATTVTAPMLGIFYRRPSPEEPLFAQAGATIEEGQTIGLIEVMKSFHEVPAPHAGTDDGQSVEFGAPLARLYRPDAPQRD